MNAHTMFLFIPTHRFKKVCLPFLGVTVLVSTLFFSAPQQTNAQWVVFDPADVAVNTVTSVAASITAGATTLTAANTTSNTWGKEFAGDGIANFIAKLIIKQLTAQTVKWINSGFKGNPAFVTDPEGFFLNIGDVVAANFLTNNAALKNLCSPFQSQIKLALVKQYLKETTAADFSCNLGILEKNYGSFTKNFVDGGWEGWFQMTQTETNNPYGAYTAAKDTLSINIGNKQDHYKQQMSMGQGFLSFERCKKSPVVNPTTVSSARPADTCDPNDESGGCVDTTPVVNADESGQPVDSGIGQGDCLNKETVTPGSIVHEQLTTALGSTWGSLVSADEVNEVVSALMTQLISHVVGGISSGIRGLTETSSANTRSDLMKLASSSPETQNENTQFTSGVNSLIPSNLGGTAPPTPTVNIPDSNTVASQNRQFCIDNPSDPSCTIVGSYCTKAPPGDPNCPAIDCSVDTSNPRCSPSAQ